MAHSKVVGKQIAKTQLERKISIQSLAESSDEQARAWYKTEAAIDSINRESALHTQKRLLLKQAERVTSDNPSTKESRRWFMHIFTRCPNGLGVVGGRSDTTVQENFRKELIIAQKAEHPNFETEASLWCPIIRDWVHRVLTTAAHIFPWKQGQDTMAKIFGQEAEHEMFSINNGLLMSTVAEKKMDKGLFVIVPYAKGESETDVREWHRSHPKRYKTRVLDKGHKEMLEVIPGSNPKINWAKLDGRELEFLSGHRPRTRYLYYAYCVAMLRRAHHQGEHEHILKDHLGRKFWGTPGPYLRRAYLLAFVEEIGADDLMDRAEEGEEDIETDPAALLAANDKIRSAHRPRGDMFTVEWQRKSWSV